MRTLSASKMIVKPELGRLHGNPVLISTGLPLSMLKTVLADGRDLDLKGELVLEELETPPQTARKQLGLPVKARS